MTNPLNLNMNIYKSTHVHPPEYITTTCLSVQISVKLASKFSYLNFKTLTKESSLLFYFSCFSDWLFASFLVNVYNLYPSFISIFFQNFYMFVILFFSTVIDTMRLCAVVGCSNSDRTLNRWKKAGSVGDVPFKFYRFPRTEPMKSQWIKLLNRKDPKTRKPWQPSKHSFVCSNHFCSGDRSGPYDLPTENLGYTYKHPKASTSRRNRMQEKIAHEEHCYTSLVQTESSVEVDAHVSLEETLVLEPEQIESVTDSSTCSACKNVDSSVALRDHVDYVGDNSKCTSCLRLSKEISDMKHVNSQILSELDCTYNSLSNSCSPVEMCLKSDENVRAFTGVNSVAQFNDLFNVLRPRAENMQYWKGDALTSSKTRDMSSGKKRGPARKLDTRSEFVLTLMKLRLGISLLFLANMFNIGRCTAGSIFSTWIRFLSSQLSCLIYWPDRERVRQLMPQSLRRCRNLICTIDCTEIFIETPSDRESQALTWSDYKKHHTIKFLVAIAPNGMISYLSHCWGGRVSDRAITLSDSFLDLIQPNDLILADRGFSIKDCVLERHATLEIPPPASGYDQLSRNDVFKTKSIASKRIHVERAIQRIKYFAILSNRLPINLIDLCDDIVTVCGALTNLREPLV